MIDIRIPASPTLITVIRQCATLLRPHLKSASEEVMMGADGGPVGLGTGKMEECLHSQSPVQEQLVPN